MKTLLLSLLLMLCAPALAQTLVITTKPIASGWGPNDFVSGEVRLNGRKSTDPLTTNRIIQRIPLAPLDISMLTGRVTVLVPPGEIWEIKSVAANFVPLAATQLKSFTIETFDFVVLHSPIAGQVLAIDVNYTTGDIFMSTVASSAPVPPVTSPAGASIPPLTQLIDSTGAVWALPGSVPTKNGVIFTKSGYNAVYKLVMGSGGHVIIFDKNYGYICQIGTLWTDVGC